MGERQGERGCVRANDTGEDSGLGGQSSRENTRCWAFLLALGQLPRSARLCPPPPPPPPPLDVTRRVVATPNPHRYGLATPSSRLSKETRSHLSVKPDFRISSRSSPSQIKQCESVRRIPITDTCAPPAKHVLSTTSGSVGTWYVDVPGTRPEQTRSDFACSRRAAVTVCSTIMFLPPRWSPQLHSPRNLRPCRHLGAPGTRSEQTRPHRATTQTNARIVAT